MAVNRRTVTIAGVTAAALLAGAVGVVRLVAGCTPGVDCGYVSGYDPPQTLVLLDVDGLTPRAGWRGCAEYAALQAVGRPDEVMLRVYWRSRRTFECGALVDEELLPRLDEAAMLRFTPPVQMSGLAGLRYRGPAYWYQHPPQQQPAELFPDRLFPAAKCIGTETNGVPVQLRLDQCAYGGAGSAAPAPSPAAGAGPGRLSAGPKVTVRGRPGHVVDHTANATPSADYAYPWRALWWVEGHEIVVLISQRTASSQPPLLTPAQLVAVADDLWCLQPAACQSPVGHRPGG